MLNQITKAKQLAATFFLSILPISISEVSFAQEQANPYSLVPCDYISYMVTEYGECIDLTYLSINGLKIINSMPRKFFRKLNALDIPVKRETCKEKNVMAYYNSGSNKMVLCNQYAESFKGENSEYINTLAHESWHIVQDCADGLNNSSIKAIGELSGETNSIMYDLMIRSLSIIEVEAIQSSYQQDTYDTEFEAFTMAKYPEVVLKMLDGCIAIQR